jgi:hypothetical protein
MAHHDDNRERDADIIDRIDKTAKDRKRKQFKPILDLTKWEGEAWNEMGNIENLQKAVAMLAKRVMELEMQADRDQRFMSTSRIRR